MLRASTRLGWAAFHVGCWLLAGSAHAQGVCEEDAGLCDEDGGSVSAVDASAPGVDVDADGGSPGASAACSCHTDKDEDGRIHVCTDSVEADVCADFSCELGRVRYSRCPTRNVELCCDMPSRGLQSRLYDDCTHPNCQSGFREQCRQFAGDLYEGDCARAAGGNAGSGGGPDAESDAKGGLCSVRAPGAAGSGSTVAVGMLLLALFACARRRSAASA